MTMQTWTLFWEQDPCGDGDIFARLLNGETPVVSTITRRGTSLRVEDDIAYAGKRLAACWNFCKGLDLDTIVKATTDELAFDLGEFIRRKSL